MEIMLKNDLILTILSMPPMDRIEIIDKVFEDFDADNSADFESEWVAESELRVDGYFDGSIKAVPAKEVFKKVSNGWKFALVKS